MWLITSVPLARPWTWSSAKAAGSRAEIGDHNPNGPRLRVSGSGCPACCCWRCSQTGGSFLHHLLLWLKIKETDRYPLQPAAHACDLFMGLHMFLWTWHEFRFVPQALEVHADEPAEWGQAGLLFIIQREAVLHKHLSICLTGKYYKERKKLCFMLIKFTLYYTDEAKQYPMGAYGWQIYQQWWKRQLILRAVHTVWGNARYLELWRGVRCKTWESSRMSSHSCFRPWLSLPSDSSSRFAYLSITSNMLAKIGVTVDWRQRHRVCLRSKVKKDTRTRWSDTEMLLGQTS